MDMKYKLIASDFDDTLALHSDDNQTCVVGQKNIQAIKDYQCAGGVFTVVSGRPLSLLLAGLEKLDIDFSRVPIIAEQGGQIGYINGRIIAQHVLDNHLALEILQLLSERGGTVFTVINGALYAKEYDEFVEKVERACTAKVNVVGDLVEYVKANKSDLGSIVISSDPSLIEEYHQEFESRYQHLTVNKSRSTLLHIAPQKAHKAEALKLLEVYLNVSNDRVLAIGDSANDLTMLQHAGLGVAVGNANDQLKSVADYIAPSCEDDGVAHVIYKAIANELYYIHK
jgi:Cof subfamily protein (haloacid dehalogenase superfamily)